MSAKLTVTQYLAAENAKLRVDREALANVLRGVLTECAALFGRQGCRCRTCTEARAVAARLGVLP